MQGFPSKRIVWTLRVLSTVALGISTYLAWVAFNSTGVAGCGGSLFDCDHVLSSRWSRLFDVPVGVGAAALYVGILLTLSFCRSNVSERSQLLAWRCLTCGSLAAGLAALWFVALQIFVIGHFCSYCLVAHACGLTIAATILWQSPLSGRSTAALSGVSLAGVLGLIGGQMLTPETPKWEAEFHVVEASPGREVPTGQPTVTPGESVFDAPDVDPENVFEAPSFDDDLDLAEDTKEKDQ